VSSASGWAYLIVFLLAYLDALVPVVPSETSVITAGVLASAGDLSLAPIVGAAASGAFLGDNTAYFIGARFGSRIEGRFFSGEKARKRLILIGRFIPGGRTAVTLSAGTLGYPWRRFVIFDAVAALGWALYASLLGYFGGSAFEAAPWKGLVLALGIAFAVAGVIEVVRWYLKRRRTA
jgi:membrane-associated protein